MIYTLNNRCIVNNFKMNTMTLLHKNKDKDNSVKFEKREC